MTEAQRQEVQELVERYVSDLSWDYANAMEQMVAPRIQHILAARPSNISAQLYNDLIVPAVTASVYKMLAGRFDKTAAEWRLIYETNRETHFETEGI